MALRTNSAALNSRSDDDTFTVNANSQYSSEMSGRDSKVRIRRMPQLRLIAAGLIVCLVLFMLLVRQVPTEPDNEPENNQNLAGRYKYGIVFDAGSTGTRIHVYRLEKADDGSLHLKDELFEEVKPGLSSFATIVSEAGHSITPLLEKAKKFIPEADWRHVPLSLYATAGLRLVSDVVAQQLLNEVQHTFAQYPFRVCSDCVRILDGLEEGTFAWYAINYLLGVTKPESMSQSVGAIDLGGGSVQITFLPQNAKAKDNTPAEYLHETNAFGGQQLTIYSHSYLGLGLNAARFELLAMTTPDADKHLSKTTNGGPRKLSDVDPDASVTYKSPCLAETYSSTWRYQAIDVHVQGTVPDNKSSRFDSCYARAKRLVTSDFDVHHPGEVHHAQFYIQSFFFDRAVDGGLITEQEGGTVTVNDYERTAKKVCETISTSKFPFLCMDLCYITALLRDGFEFEANSELILRKKIKGVELSWAVGAVFPLLQ